MRFRRISIILTLSSYRNLPILSNSRITSSLPYDPYGKTKIILVMTVGNEYVWMTISDPEKCSSDSSRSKFLRGCRKIIKMKLRWDIQPLLPSYTTVSLHKELKSLIESLSLSRINRRGLVVSVPSLLTVSFNIPSSPLVSQNCRSLETTTNELLLWESSLYKPVVWFHNILLLESDIWTSHLDVITRKFLMMA